MECDKHMKGMDYKKEMAYKEDDYEKLTAKKIVDSADIDIKKAVNYKLD